MRRCRSPILLGFLRTTFVSYHDSYGFPRNVLVNGGMSTFFCGSSTSGMKLVPVPLVTWHNAQHPQFALVYTLRKIQLALCATRPTPHGA